MQTQHSWQNHLREASVRDHQLQIAAADLEGEDVVAECVSPAIEQELGSGLLLPMAGNGR